MNKDAVAEMSQQYQVETAQKVVPEGYKQTEVGVTNSSGANLNATCGGPKGKGMDSRRIPEGWRCLPFEDALTIRHGRDQKTVESINGKYPIFGTGGQMGWAMEYLYDKPSVLIGRKGSINKPRYMETPFWTVDTLFYSEIKSGFNAKFIFYKFCMINWEQYNEASGVPSLNSKTIEKVTALFPTFKEQCIIANALSDTDALLSELEKLIAKKQAIKTATMQQLLTGRTRLPQFAHHPDGSKKGYKQSELGEIPEDWEVVSLGEFLVNGQLGGNYSNSEIESEYPLIKMGNLNRGRIKLDKIEYSAIKPEEKDRLFYGDVLLNTRNTLELVGKVAIWRDEITKAYFNSNLMRLNFNKHLIGSGFFVNLLMNTDRFLNGLSGIAIGTTSVAAIYLRDLLTLKVVLPSKQEQTAIATILSDMDAEIQALEHRLAKTRQIKQGMMQELLTGKTRLVASQSR